MGRKEKHKRLKQPAEKDFQVDPETSRVETPSHAVGGGRSRAAFSPRTRAILLILLVPLGYISYRSVTAYRLRSYAWEAAELRNAGRWRKLESVAAEWAQLDPDVALPWLMAAEGAERQGSIERVAGYLENLPPDDPRTPDLLLELATFYFGQLNKPQQGVEACQRSLQLSPGNSEAHRRLVFYYGITLQRAELIGQTRQAIASRGDSQETYVYLIGANWLTFSNAYEFNGKWLQSGQNIETYAVAEALHARGSANAFPQGEDVQEVDADRVKRLEHQKMLRKFFGVYPENIELLVYFLEQAAIRGDEAEVATLLGQVPATAAEDNRVWYYKGWLHSVRDELQDAEASYRKALDLHPYAWRSQLDLANVLRRMNRFEEVEKLNQLSLMGKQIREEVLQLPDVQSVPVALFRKMQEYAAGCGDDATATRMAERLENLEQAG